MNNIKLPNQCPACNEPLVVTQLSCNACQTTINGSFVLPQFLKLNVAEQNFVMQFFLNSGSLKEMAKQLHVSYPTVRNQLDDIISKLTNTTSK
ncbi:DUF2089 domain-containing protein [Flavobacterium agricola]|uniref:DUF2089 domain-containing protein n=1 Tax=Flavobacterium agricola TaxID=2870839 RepID=A0ABY6LZT0_9FLAO|nr:DUF2089 domain-containing protein [Flavobacterium agricola]UYW00975.1 DUF2089 domain-containing protein [Flavobacterium agricola]